MSIVLLILKIVGIIILSLIGLLLAVVLLVLFCPLAYRIKGQYLTDEKPYLNIRVTWLFRVISLIASYEDEFVVKIKVLFITIYTNKKKDKTSNIIKLSPYDNNKFGDSDINMEGFDNSDIEDNEPDNSEYDNNIDNSKNINISTNEEFVIDDYFNYYDTIENNEQDYTSYDLEHEEYKEFKVNTDEDDGLHNNNEATSERQPFIVRIFSKILNDIKFIYIKIKDIVVLVIDIIKSFIDNACRFTDDVNIKMNKLKNKIDGFNAIINDERNIRYVKLVISEIKHLLKSISPRKLKGFLNYGFDDPSYTGKTCGYISIIRPYIKKEFKIVPYFNKQIFEVSADMKGHIFVFVLLNAVIKIYFNKDRKHLMNLMRNN